MITLFAGVNGYSDQIPVNRIKEWQEGLLKFVATSHPEKRKTIGTEKRLSDELQQNLREVIKVYNATWK